MKIIIDGTEPQFKVYKMEENVNNKIYIGSTSYPLKCRMNSHKQSHNKVDRYFSEIGWNNVTVQIIDSASDKTEMKKKENMNIENYKNVHSNLLNKNKAYTGMNRNEYARHSYLTKKEYYKKYFTRKVICDVCNACIQKSGTSHHNKTKKHNKFIIKLQNETDIKPEII